METDIMALMIPIFGIVFGVGVAIVTIVTAHREKVKRAELRHRERLAAIEKGIELPPDPPDLDYRKKGSLAAQRPDGPLRRHRAVLRIAIAVADS